GVVGGAEYVIIDYAGAPLADINGLTLSSPTLGSLGVSLVHDTANTQIKLRVAAAAPPQWNVDSSGSWGNDNNWSTFVQPNRPTGCGWKAGSRSPRAGPSPRNWPAR